MQKQRLNRLSFNRRSLALFASLAVGSGLAAAQFTVGPANAGKAKATQNSDMFARLDTDRNGSISRKEAASSGGFFARNFDALDSNHDGLLSRAEFESASK